MRTIFALALAIGLTVTAQAQEKEPTKQAPKQPPKKAEPSLKVGDPAPELTATEWLQGEPVKSFAKDHVYVVEFWATWCGPCIVMMPHMGEMQKEYKGKVTFIGYSAKDPNNTQEKVTEFVKKRGPKLGYTFAYADDRDTYDAWMRAAGRNGIPCCFVVDQTNKIAYIGHPMYLDVVLPKVVAGKWTEEDIKGMEQIEEDVNNLFRTANGADAEAGLKAFEAFETKYPALAHIPYFISAKISLRVKAKKFDEAKAIAKAVILTAIKQEDPTALRSVVGALRNAEAQADKELAALSLEAAEAGVKVTGGDDAIALYYLAEAHFAAGNKEKALEIGKKAVGVADGRLKEQLEQLTKKYAEEPKKEEDKEDK